MTINKNQLKRCVTVISKLFAGYSFMCLGTKWKIVDLFPAFLPAFDVQAKKLRDAEEDENKRVFFRQHSDKVFPDL